VRAASVRAAATMKTASFRFMAGGIAEFDEVGALIVATKQRARPPGESP
jgi:hypothetical protein